MTDNALDYLSNSELVVVKEWEKFGGVKHEDFVKAYLWMKGNGKRALGINVLDDDHRFGLVLLQRKPYGDKWYYVDDSTKLYRGPVITHNMLLGHLTSYNSVVNFCKDPNHATQGVYGTTY